MPHGLSKLNPDDLAGTIAAASTWDSEECEGEAFVIRTDGTRVTFGIGGRVGAKVSPDAKLYAVSTYQTKNCKFCEDSVTLGAGYQQNFGEKLYGKVEYRHHFVENVSDYDAALVGLGVRF